MGGAHLKVLLRVDAVEGEVYHSPKIFYVGAVLESRWLSSREAQCRNQCDRPCSKCISSLRALKTPALTRGVGAGWRRNC